MKGRLRRWWCHRLGHKWSSESISGCAEHLTAGALDLGMEPVLRAFVMMDGEVDGTAAVLEYWSCNRCRAITGMWVPEGWKPAWEKQ